MGHLGFLILVFTKRSSVGPLKLQKLPAYTAPPCTSTLQILVVKATCLGVFQRPLTLILLQKYRDTNGRRIAIQIGGVYTTLSQGEGIL